MLDCLIIEDTPFLERLLLLGHGFREEMVISVISARKLKVLGQLPVVNPMLKFDTSVFKVRSKKKILGPLTFLIEGIQLALPLVFILCLLINAGIVCS